MSMHNVVERIDANNVKALKIVSLAILALENGHDDFNVIDILEVIKDYLSSNDKIFDGLT